MSLRTKPLGFFDKAFLKGAGLRHSAALRHVAFLEPLDRLS